MILHIEPEKLLVFYPDSHFFEYTAINRDWERKEAEAFLKYAYSARAFIKSIIIVTPDPISRLHPMVRHFVNLGKFKLVDSKTARKYLRWDFYDE